MFGIPTKFVAIAIALTVAGSAAFIAFNWIEGVGAMREREKINSANKESGDAGEIARLNLRECRARGLRWDFETGKCVG